MDIKSLMHADYLDIVFDNRNKSYGGYELRRHYGGRVGKAAAILYSALAAILVFAVFQTPAARPLVDIPIHRPYNPTPFYPDVEKVLPPTPVAPPRAKMKLKTNPFTVPVITKEPVPDDKQMTPVENMQNSNPGIGIGVDSTDPGIGSENTGSGKGNAIPVAVVPDVPKVYVEQMPRFDGNLSDYLSRNVHYPEAARANNEEGKVVIQFVVDETGAVTGARVAKGIGGGCDEEALRVVSSMPKWKPGRQNGIAVKVYFSVTVNFELQ